MTTTRETLIADLNAAQDAEDAAKVNRPTMPRDALNDRSARARYLWADRAAKRNVRALMAATRAARAALHAAGFSEDE